MLGEILRDLLREGILRVARGPGGGYQLRGAPEQISVSRLVEVLEGSAMKGPICGHVSGSPAAKVGGGFDELADRLREVLEGFTLARFATGFAAGNSNQYEGPRFSEPRPVNPSREGFEFLLK